jgi:hypothetical protein
LSENDKGANGLKKRNDIVIDNFLHMNMRTIVRVPIIAVYDNPTDYPGKYVARLWDIKNKPTNIVVVKDSLEAVRKAIPEGMHRIGRHSTDDPVIVETWIG